MLKNPKVYRKLKIGLKHWGIILTSIILFTTPVFAEDVIENIILSAEDRVCLPLSDTKKIVVELEKNIIYVQQIELLEKTNIQMLEQNGLLTDQILLLQKKYDLKNEQYLLTLKLIDDQQVVYEEKIKVCEETKTTFMDKVMIGLGGAGVGAVLTLVLIILL